jgi:hypothetical protein
MGHSGTSKHNELELRSFPKYLKGGKSQRIKCARISANIVDLEIFSGVNVLGFVLDM